MRVIVVLAAVFVVAKAFSYNYGTHLRPVKYLGFGASFPIRKYQRLATSYGQEIPEPVTTSPAVVAPLRPIEDLNIPEQGPGFLVPETRARPSLEYSSKAHLATSYGEEIPVQQVAPLKPIQDLDIPEEGPGFIIPQQEKSALNEEVSQSSNGHFLYQYEYQDLNSEKQETLDENGITRGFYAYVDPNGMLRRVEYTADDQNGYQVTSLAQPQDSPEVAKAKVEFFKAYNLAVATNSV